MPSDAVYARGGDYDYGKDKYKPKKPKYEPYHPDKYKHKKPWYNDWDDWKDKYKYKHPKYKGKHGWDDDDVSGSAWLQRSSGVGLELTLDLPPLPLLQDYDHWPYPYRHRGKGKYDHDDDYDWDDYKHRPYKVSRARCVCGWMVARVSADPQPLTAASLAAVPPSQAGSRQGKHRPSVFTVMAVSDELTPSTSRVSAALQTVQASQARPREALQAPPRASLRPQASEARQASSRKAPLPWKASQA